LNAVNEQPDTDGSLNWPLITFCCVAGLVMLGAAVGFQTAWDWMGVTTEALVEGGIALAFVGVAFLFERRFVRRIASAATTAAEARFEQQTRALQTQLDDLTDEVHKRGEREAEIQDEEISRLDTEPSFETVMQALRTADDLNAIPTFVRVSATAEPDLLDLSFGRTTASHPPYGYRLEVAIVPGNARSAPNGAPIELWTHTKSAVDFGDSIRKRIIREALLEKPTDFDWSLAIRNLQNLLRVAVRSRRKADGAWHLEGKLYRLMTEDWALTEAGLEHRDPRFFLSGSEFRYRFMGPTQYPDRNQATPRISARLGRCSRLGAAHTGWIGPL
jgi:hypothetical protein